MFYNVYFLSYLYQSYTLYVCLLVVCIHVCMLCYAVLCYAMFCFAVLCCVVVCYAMLCYVVVRMLCYDISCYVVLCATYHVFYTTCTYQACTQIYIYLYECICQHWLVCLLQGPDSLMQVLPCVNPKAGIMSQYNLTIQEDPAQGPYYLFMRPPARQHSMALAWRGMAQDSLVNVQ